MLCRRAWGYSIFWVCGSASDGVSDLVIIVLLRDDVLGPFEIVGERGNREPVDFLDRQVERYRRSSTS